MKRRWHEMRILEIPDGTEQIEEYQYSEQRDLEEVHIPDSVHKIGKLAFYNCRNLKKVRLPGDLFQIQDGVFKNCNALQEVEIKAENGITACMKNIVADLSHEITFLIHYSDGDAKILIPSYNYDYEIDINSRVFHEVVYGSGDAYQRCVGKAELDFSEYDFLFAVAKREENHTTLFELSENRLQYPYHLSEKEEQDYFHFLKKHAKEYILCKIKKNDQDGLRLAGKYELFEQSDMEEYIEQASRKKQIECTAYLMEYRNQKFSEIEAEFIF
jgi:hypothetical protein